MAAESWTIREEDLLTYRLGRRVIRRDVGRLAALADGLYSGSVSFTARRREAYAEFVEMVCEEIAAHQDCEETFLRPVLRDHVPDSPVLDDDGELRARLDEARRAARTIVHTLAQRPAEVATLDDHHRARDLATSWGALRDRLEDHFGATEPGMTTVVERVPRARWLELLDGVRRRRPDMSNSGARMVEAASDEEREILRAQFGRRLVGVRHRQGRRLAARATVVFGPEIVR